MGWAIEFEMANIAPVSDVRVQHHRRWATAPSALDAVSLLANSRHQLTRQIVRMRRVDRLKAAIDLAASHSDCCEDRHGDAADEDRQGNGEHVHGRLQGPGGQESTREDTVGWIGRHSQRRGERAVSLDHLPLETKSLLMRQVVLDDAGELFLLSNEAAFRTWLPSQVYHDESHARSVLEFLIGQYSNPANPRQGAYVLAIEHKADQALIGHVGLGPIDDDVEIGFAIAQRYQSRGLAAEAIVAASRWAFKTFELDSILGITSSMNTGAKRALLRAEFAHREDKVMRFQGSEQPVSVYALFPGDNVR